MVGRAVDTLLLSGRGVSRVLRVARTIADVDRVVEVGEHHVAEALGYRAPQRAEAVPA